MDQTMAESEAVEGIPVTATSMEDLPEGCAVIVGDDGRSYVTVEQDGQTYAIPEEDYHAARRSGGGNGDLAPPITITPTPAAATTVVVEERRPPDPPPGINPTGSVTMVPISQPLDTLTLQPLPGPPPVLAKKLIRPAFKSPAPVKRHFRPIKVDNWGIFLLGRLQAYFQKKEHCDLTLRFPARNAQIKVHRLVVNACTDYFSSLEQQEPDAVDMPDDLTPDLVAPIIRFMYTGRLEVRGEGTFEKLRTTADLLKMSVLTKLMDAQLHGQPLAPPAKNSKRRCSTLDPVKQMKKIKKIEREFNEEERRARIAARAEARRRELSRLGGADTVPGKKLPIWKKRSSAGTNAQELETPSSSREPSEKTRDQSAQQKIVLKPVSGPPPGAKLLPVKGPPSHIVQQPSQLKPTVSPRAYGGGRSSLNGSRSAVPRKIREIQENLTFEKIIRTGAKNPTASVAVSEDAGAADMSVEEMKEFMEEQRKRLEQIGDEEADDYYGDNDAGIDYDDDDIGRENDEDVGEKVELNLPTISASPAKPILKHEKADEYSFTETSQSSSVPRKSVRFSLRPGTGSSGPSKEPEEILPDIATPPSKSRSGKISDDSLDSTVDEFSRALEEEEGEQEQEQVRSRSGRLIVKRKMGDEDSSKKSSPKAKSSSPSAEEKSPPSKRRRISSGSGLAPSPEIDLPPQSKSETMVLPVIAGDKQQQSSSSPSVIPNHAQLIEEVLKKCPNILKDNKQVKLKVVTKDSSGKDITQFIMLRASEGSEVNTASEEHVEDDQQQKSLFVGFREVPKVKYTGRRGRPKKLLPGESDPHEQEREDIEKRRSKTSGDEMTTLDQVSSQEPTSVPVSAPPPLDPSSEAEALSNVASSIATSLGVVEQQQQHVIQEIESTTTTLILPEEESAVAVQASGPLSDLEQFPPQQAAVVVNYEEAAHLVVAESEETMGLFQSSDDGTTILVAAPAAVSLKTGEEKKEENKDKKVKGISKIAQDWDEDEDEGCD